MDAEPTALKTERSPETVDRMFVGACGVIWLVLIAACVFAITALARLASGHPSGAEQQSSWLLYSVIVISALVISGAIPLLLRARRAAQPASADELEAAVPHGRHAAEAPTEKVRVFGVDPYAAREAVVPSAGRGAGAAVDRLWLRGTMALLAATGLALTAVAVGTYLLAAVGDTAAWIAFAVAGAISVAMPAVLAFFQRQVGEALEAAEPAV